MTVRRKAFLFALAMLPIAVLGGYFIGRYMLDMYDPAVLAQMGGDIRLIALSVAQTVFYACGLGFVGYILSEKTGLMRPFRFERAPLARTALFALALGALLSLDYWTFGRWIPQLDIAASTAAGLTISGWLGAVLYGGVVEEIMLRLFAMSLLVWLGWRLFFPREERAPVGVIIAANVLSALLFAAGHLPATEAMFGAVTPLMLLRCFLLNGAFGLFFGRLYRKYGIQYAMLGHGLLHIVSKTIWALFAL